MEEGCGPENQPHEHSYQEALPADQVSGCAISKSSVSYEANAGIEEGGRRDP